MDAVRVPDVIAGPAEVLHHLEWPLAESLQAEVLFVQRLGEMRMEPYAVPAREHRRLAHQLEGHGERRAWRHHDATHRTRRRLVEGVNLLLGVREDRVLVFDHAVRRKAALGFAQ